MQLFIKDNIRPLLMLLLVLTLICGCGANSDTPEEPAGMQLINAWGATTAQVKGLESGELVSDKPDVLIYKTRLNNYPVYLNYEFNEDGLVRFYLNLNAKNNDGEANMAMVDYLETLVIQSFGRARYVFSDKVLFLSKTTLVEMQVDDSWGGVKAKIAFYDANAPQNLSFVQNFETLWLDERWAHGFVE